MSVLTEVVIYATMVDANDFARSVLDLDFDGQKFKRLDTSETLAHKTFCGEVYVACFNYIPPERIKDALSKIQWDEDLRPVVVIDYEHADDLEIWRP